MKFVQEERAQLEAELVNELETALAKGDVTLLVPGGSNIISVIRVLEEIGRANSDKLTLLLSDERYGPIGHADSNYFQLKEMGLNLHRATFVETLTDSSLDDTVRYYGAAAKKLLTEADTVIAFLGMGADGHIAGILPGSPAASTTNEWAVSYVASQFTRITLTSMALSHVDVAVVGAYGKEKGLALTKLANQELSLTVQPAQLLKRLPKVTIFNGQIVRDS